MYCPNAFKETRRKVLHQLIRDYPLAQLITIGIDGPMANPVPFSLHPGEASGVLRAHLPRQHPQLETLLKGGQTLLIFQGPQCYVSPSWYPSKAEHGRVVPTWNYATVQVRGVARVIDDAAWVRDQIDYLTHQLEHQRDDAWQVEDAPADFTAGLLKALVGVEIPIQAIEGKWKVSQNRSPADRQGVRDGLEAEGRCPEMLAAMGHRG
ncbi:FMN-binding negative transcriptional regulator [Chromobacterium sp. IIBBL 290-4]|uniref:FMN-binding negative transcriptional regulator n=1 Tax=Chromobacterium sp. IIBBL 290-4 TaxID=2953890 RepID=UPI0020B82714|nr:FMN-binding negative transcriptional regulator [Chromobacterium sp. IIBBL 290-4]UTH75688.1 FMN-binding negative transcriptional regulator [Chromobacterium sp. IIBBL 290-4]